MVGREATSLGGSAAESCVRCQEGRSVARVRSELVVGRGSDPIADPGGQDNKSKSRANLPVLNEVTSPKAWETTLASLPFFRPPSTSTLPPSLQTAGLGLTPQDS